jgi:plasmid stabilization system protein ParE
MTILIRPAAAAEIDDAFLWYERQQAGLGEDFLAALEKVEAHPSGFPVVHRETRRILVHRFSYGIFYRVYGDLVVVVACMHGRRDPKRWQRLP